MPTLNRLTREADLQKSRRASYRLLEPVPEMGYGDPAAENLLIQGDNLDALKALLPYYAGRVKCIYIDPPYNTKSAFEHYDDNLEHSQWLSMIYPRLELLRELLSEDGSIWVSIDDNEGHYLKVGLDTLVRGKFVLAKTMREKIAACRQQAYGHGYQETLFSPRAAVETSYRFAFDYPKDNYPARLPYKGAYHFGKHYYPFVGELESTGEEFECAQLIDGLSEIKHWVRNLTLQPAFSFWLPTSTDRFYPDFVAELTDGRILVVEYKGGHIADSADTREKRNLGALWEEKSGGKGLFLMAEKRDGAGRDLFRQLAEKIRRES